MEPELLRSLSKLRNEIDTELLWETLSVNLHESDEDANRDAKAVLKTYSGKDTAFCQFSSVRTDGRS